MFGIRHNIIFSATAHSILLAAALLIGSSSEIRKASLMTVLLSDEKEGSSPGKQTAVADKKQHAQPMITPKPEVKPVTKLFKAQEIAPKQHVAPLAPVRPQSDSDSGPAPGLTGIETQRNSSHDGGSSPASVSSQTFRGSSTESGAALASRGQKGQSTETGADASLKQRIRDALQANLVYPYIARKRKMEGTVLVDFSINHKGMAENVRVSKGSGYALLDSSAIETVVKSSPFPVENYLIEVPITYRLTQN